MVEDAVKPEINYESNSETKPQPNEEHATSFEHERATLLDEVPKHRIDDRQNYKKNNHKAKPKNKFSKEELYLQKQHSIKIKPQKSSKEAKLKRHLKKETQKVDQKSSNYKGSAGVIDKDKSKTHLGSKKNTIYKQNKSRAHEFNKKLLHHKVLALPVAVKNTTANYGWLEEQKESDENSAVLASDEGVTLVGRTLKKTTNTKHAKLRFETSKDKFDLESKQQVLKQRLSYVKQRSYMDKPKQINKNQQKQSIKKAYNMKKNSTFNTGIKDRLNNTLRQVKAWVINGSKKFAINMIGPIAMFVIASVLILSVVQSFLGAVSTVVATSYQSNDLVVTNADVLYTRLEADLLYAINRVEEDYSGYDEFRYYVDTIGHDPHMVIAYLTAKFGEFTDTDASNELSRIFELHYNYRLIEKVETRYKTVRRTSVDSETGETTTITSREAYNWHVLKVILDASDLEQIFVSQLNDDEKDLYETLFVTKGNFISFPSPIKEEWQNAVSSPFGYRLDPMSKNVTFHGGIDIAKPTGTELMAIIDGKVIKIGYDLEGYGHYIITEAEKSKITILYAHCNSILAKEGDEVIKGQTIATIGSSGKSTGPHVHLEIRDSNGNKLNPYFYLSSEIIEEN